MANGINWKWPLKTGYDTKFNSLVKDPSFIKLHIHVLYSVHHGSAHVKLSFPDIVIWFTL